jgi:hypothetical protein
MDVGFLDVLPGPSFGRAVDSGTFEQEVKPRKDSLRYVRDLKTFKKNSIYYPVLGTSAPAF